MCVLKKPIMTEPQLHTPIPLPQQIQLRRDETEADNLKTARIYLLWGKPDSNGLCPLYYCGSSRQTRKQRFYGHKRAARCDPLKSPLHRFAHAENQTDPMSDWTITQLCEFEYDTVLCADARVLLEQHFIDSLRAAGYNDMLMRNNALCKDTRRRAQMARWRSAHPGYMSAAARHHKELRDQKLRKQQQAQAKTAQQQTVPTENAQEQTVPMDTESAEQ